jgi:GalNAc-alpha-(1->4)-GalNAc-alpha-(1->3)-diNAcBac-PP-undecaprenol alpha-1,4-N-acetyl-D-galactosaminyltransferase
MKIVCCIHSLSGGGAEHLMAGFANRLAELHDVTLITLSTAETDLYEVADSVKRIGLDLVRPSPSPVHGLYNNFRRIQSLRKAIRSSQPNVVISFCDQINVMTVLACRRLRLPVIAAEMSDPRFHRMPRLWGALRPYAYRRAAAVTAVSQASLPTVSQFRGEQAVFIPPAVDAPELKSKDTPVSGRHRLVSLGRLSEEKRFDMLIEAFSKVAEEFPQWDLEIAGSGPCETMLQQQIKTRGLQERVRLRGRIPIVWDFLAGSDLFASSSLYEGTPVSVLEAMKVGLPVVAVDCDSGINEVVRADQNGLLTENSVGGLATGLQKLMRDTELRQRCSEAAESTAAYYSWERFVGDYIRLIKSVAI